MAKGLVIKYHQLNEPGTHIYGDHLIVWKGQEWLTKEDLKRFPSRIHLKAPPGRLLESSAQMFEKFLKVHPGGKGLSEEDKRLAARVGYNISKRPPPPRLRA